MSPTSCWPSIVSVTYCFYILYEVHERGVCPVRLEYLPLVEQWVDQMRVGVQTVAQSRVYNLQNHQQDLLQNSTICCLKDNKRMSRCLLPSTTSGILSLISLTLFYHPIWQMTGKGNLEIWQDYSPLCTSRAFFSHHLSFLALQHYTLNYSKSKYSLDLTQMPFCLHTHTLTRQCST